MRHAAALAVLIAFTAAAHAANRTISLTAPASLTAQSVEWYQADSVELRLAAPYAPCDLAQCDLAWTIADIAGTGVYVNAEGEGVGPTFALFNLSPTNSNLTPGRYNAYVRATQGTTNHGVIAIQSVTVKWSPAGGDYPAVGPLSAGEAIPLLWAAISNRIEQSVWATADSTTNYLPRTGGAVSGTYDFGTVHSLTNVDMITAGLIQIPVAGSMLRMYANGGMLELDGDLHLAGHAVTGAVFHGDGAGITNLPHLLSNVWATADSTTNYFPRTGGAVGGSVTISNELTIAQSGAVTGGKIKFYTPAGGGGAEISYASGAVTIDGAAVMVNRTNAIEWLSRDVALYGNLSASNLYAVNGFEILDYSVAPPFPTLIRLSTNGLEVGTNSFRLSAQTGQLLEDWDAGAQTITAAAFVGDGAGLTNVGTARGTAFPLTNNVTAAGYNITGIGTLGATTANFTDLNVTGTETINHTVTHNYSTNIYLGTTTNYVATTVYSSQVVYQTTTYVTNQTLYTTNFTTYETVVQNGGYFDASNVDWFAAPHMLDSNGAVAATGDWDFSGASVVGLSAVTNIGAGLTGDGQAVPLAIDPSTVATGTPLYAESDPAWTSGTNAIWQAIADIESSAVTGAVATINGLDGAVTIDGATNSGNTIYIPAPGDTTLGTPSPGDVPVYNAAPYKAGVWTPAISYDKINDYNTGGALPTTGQPQTLWWHPTEQYWYLDQPYAYSQAPYDTNAYVIGTNVAIYRYTGITNEFVVPPGVSTLQVKLWGSAGANGNTASKAGQGGYATGYLAVTNGETLNIVVGGGGTNNYLAGAFGGGGNGAFGGGGGGGYSAVFRGTNDLVVAGGGGGVYVNNSGGAGGGLIAGAGTSAAGGTQTNGYARLQGQSASSRGGGGGGYWGGYSSALAGGGGSGYIGGLMPIGATTYTGLFTLDDDYESGVASPSASTYSHGGPGLVVIRW